jgi:uncharacterized membrane protein YccF (DUF307 family)
MRTILNVLWNVPGLGFVAAFFWVLAGLLMAITIIGLPWAKACFTLANYTLAPFGRELVSRYDRRGFSRSAPEDWGCWQMSSGSCSPGGG